MTGATLLRPAPFPIVAAAPMRAVQTALFCDGEATTSGTVVATTSGTGRDWADEVVASLRAGEHAITTIAFAPGQPGIAHRIRTTPAAWLDATSAVDADIERVHTVVERPTAKEYAGNVRTALEQIDAGRLEKVVLGRGLDVTSTPPLDPATLVERLRRARPGRYVFQMPLTRSATLIGASPELLVSRHGYAVSSFPLAGSIPRVSDPVEDHARAQALLESTKDLHEHAFVVDAIVKALAEVCESVTADEAPRLVTTDQLHHLGTRIEAVLTPGAAHMSALHLAQLLQPTPAVGGTPREEALDLIAQLEGDRGALTGATGWVDAAGDGEFAVTIRAGVLDGAHLRLFAGAGIVAGSDPQSEVRETGAKLATMRSAVGV